MLDDETSTSFFQYTTFFVCKDGFSLHRERLRIATDFLVGSAHTLHKPPPFHTRRLLLQVTFNFWLVYSKILSIERKSIC